MAYKPAFCVYSAISFFVPTCSYTRSLNIFNSLVFSNTFCNEPHQSHVLFLWRLNSARPPHPGHSTILLTCLSLCNTQARAVNPTHAIICDDEGVTQARGCLRHETDRGIERWHCTTVCAQPDGSRCSLLQSTGSSPYVLVHIVGSLAATLL